MILESNNTCEAPEWGTVTNEENVASADGVFMAASKSVFQMGAEKYVFLCVWLLFMSGEDRAHNFRGVTRL